MKNTKRKNITLEKPSHYGHTNEYEKKFNATFQKVKTRYRRRGWDPHLKK